MIPQILYKLEIICSPCCTSFALLYNQEKVLLINEYYVANMEDQLCEHAYAFISILIRYNLLFDDHYLNKWELTKMINEYTLTKREKSVLSSHEMVSCISCLSKQQIINLSGHENIQLMPVKIALLRNFGIGMISCCILFISRYSWNHIFNELLDWYSLDSLWIFKTH